MIRYRNVLASKRARAASARSIQKVTRAVGRDLPDPYVRFVSVADGLAAPFSLVLGGRSYGFGLEPLESLVEEFDLLEDAWFRDRLPPHVLPIGRTGGEDDTLLLDLGDGTPGAVLAWISARPARGVPDDALHVVAPDFDAFIDALVLFETDLEDDDVWEEDAVARAWFVERGEPTMLTVDGIDLGRRWSAT